MRYDAKTVTTDLIEELFHILPFPIKNTFMIAFNQHEGPAGCSAMNPFCEMFRLLDRFVSAVREADYEHRQNALTLGWIDRRRKDVRQATMRHFTGVAR